MNITYDKIHSLPFANYGSRFLDEALRIAFNLKPSAGFKPEIDALIWLHYGQGRAPLDLDGLCYVLETQFGTLKQNNPEYVKNVVSSYKYYAQKKWLGCRDERVLPTKEK
ncbi:MAG: hypothetical protein QW818_02550 [Candidatus Aenigmatarchaeota archaeon]